jgi:tRNA threonylcarbamoyl adenosine modification protein YjeE
LRAPGRVQSPTFVLVQPHEGGRLPLWHADWYRLRSEAEAEALGLFEVATGGVVAVEWADRFPGLLPDERLDIVLTDDGVGREIEVIGRGAAHRAIEAGLEATLG